ncbi:Netrin receptor UNC5B [Taenia solium]|eukprot:TsM_000867200 transcript=TsM_000867200 gene=TsM_000867200
MSGNFFLLEEKVFMNDSCPALDVTVKAPSTSSMGWDKMGLCSSPSLNTHHQDGEASPYVSVHIQRCLEITSVGKHLQPNQTGSNSYNEQNEFRLPSYVVFQLCSMLDPIAPLGNDWRQLAQHLAMERFLPYFASTQRPTEMVLNLWEASTTAKGSLAHQELINILQSMHRLDCANLVRSQVSLVSSRKDHV